MTAPTYTSEFFGLSPDTWLVIFAVVLFGVFVLGFRVGRVFRVILGLIATTILLVFLIGRLGIYFLKK